MDKATKVRGSEQQESTADLTPTHELICSGNRQRQYSEARSVLAWLAVEEVGHPAAEVARFLGISRVGVLLSLEKAKDICQKYELQLTPPNLKDSIWREAT